MNLKLSWFRAWNSPTLWRLFLSLAVLFSSSMAATVDDPPRPFRPNFLEFENAAPTIALFSDSALPGTEITNKADWDRWIRQQDHAVRSRIERGVEDSISNLILFGTSFTMLPRIDSLDNAMTADGVSLTPAARARLQDLLSAVNGSSHAERIAFIREFLANRRIPRGERQAFLGANLRRAAAEQRAYRAKLEAAARSGDKSAQLLTQGTLYASRGLSADTSLLPNFAIEDTLRVMLSKGAVRPGLIKRVAIVGPGLDFSDKRDGYDFYPLQTIQPFAVMEALERLSLGRRESLQVISLDLNPAVNAHIAALAARARTGHAYPLQLPRDAQTEWTADALAYWQHFGEIIGAPAKPLAVPNQLPSLQMKAIAVSPDRAARLMPVDLNIVTQVADLTAAQKFDLVVATNILVYYDQFQQALAMSNLARMMNPGGIFISNTPLPAAHDGALKYLGGRSVAYAPDHSYGDDIVVYRKE